MKKVTIIIVNYNGWMDTIECLESVFRNEYANYCVVVVDNDSRDGSLQRIRAWAEGGQSAVVPDGSPLKHLSSPAVEKPINFAEYDRMTAESGGDFDLSARLVLVRSGENKGFASGNNIGIRYALARNDSDYLWLLNNDTVIDSHALLELVDLAEQDEKIGMVGSKLLHYGFPDRIQVLGGTTTISWRGFGSYHHPDEKDRPDLNRPFRIHGYIGGASLLVRTGVVEQIGLLDENYFMLIEESDWCLRCSQAGWSLFCCGMSAVWHKIGASSNFLDVVQARGGAEGRPSLGRFVLPGYYGVRNHIYFMKKHFKSRFALSLFVLLPSLLRSMIGIIIFDTRKLVRLGLVLRGVFDGLTGRMGKVIDPVTYKESI